MSSFKEIVTKAIIGKGKKYFKNNYSVEASGVTNVLGCWVINHKFKGYKTGEKILLRILKRKRLEMSLLNHFINFKFSRTKFFKCNFFSNF